MSNLHLFSTWRGTICRPYKMLPWSCCRHNHSYCDHLAFERYYTQINANVYKKWPSYTKHINEKWVFCFIMQYPLFLKSCCLICHYFKNSLYFVRNHKTDLFLQHIAGAKNPFLIHRRPRLANDIIMANNQAEA